MTGSGLRFLFKKAGKLRTVAERERLRSLRLVRSAMESVKVLNVQLVADPYSGRIWRKLEDDWWLRLAHRGCFLFLETPGFAGGSPSVTVPETRLSWSDARTVVFDRLRIGTIEGVSNRQATGFAGGG